MAATSCYTSIQQVNNLYGRTHTGGFLCGVATSSHMFTAFFTDAVSWWWYIVGTAMALFGNTGKMSAAGGLCTHHSLIVGAGVGTPGRAGKLGCDWDAARAPTLKHDRLPPTPVTGHSAVS